MNANRWLTWTWLDVAAKERRAGEYYWARVALNVSRMWPKPRLPK